MLNAISFLRCEVTCHWSFHSFVCYFVVIDIIKCTQLKSFVSCAVSKKKGQCFEFGNHLLFIFLCYCAPWNNSMVVAPVIIVVQYLRCQFSWDRSIIKRAQLKSIVSCAVSKKQASVLNSETIYFSSSYVIVYRGIILRTWLQLKEWYNIFDANCWYQTRPVCVETGVETMENYTQNGGVILPRGSDRADWGLDFGPHRYFKRKLLEKTPNTSKKRDNVPIHSRTVSHGIVGHTTQTCIPGACILACTILPGEGGGKSYSTKFYMWRLPTYLNLWISYTVDSR